MYKTNVLLIHYDWDKQYIQDFLSMMYGHVNTCKNPFLSIILFSAMLVFFEVGGVYMVF